MPLRSAFRSASRTAAGLISTPCTCVRERMQDVWMQQGANLLDTLPGTANLTTACPRMPDCKAPTFLMLARATGTCFPVRSKLLPRGL